MLGVHARVPIAAAALIASATTSVACRAQPPFVAQAPVLAPIPASGDSVPQLASFDAAVLSLMKTYAMPGASIAVVKDGRLVYARGFGWGDVEARVPVEPTSLFRIASVSKPITAAAIMKLVEDGKLKLTDRAFDYLRDLTPPRGATRDPRIDSITIEMLLQHRGGWDRDATFDPVFKSDSVAIAVGAPRPASAETVIRYMLGQPLQFTPGKNYSYSNVGYTVLGRVIERVTGTSYEEYVRQAILEPAGANSMRVGRTRPSDRATGEVKYYSIGGEAFDARLANSLYPGEPRVPLAYGFHVEAMDAHAGWIGSAIDVARFITAVDGRPTRPDVLRGETVEKMAAVPPITALSLMAQQFFVRMGDSGWSTTTTVGRDSTYRFVVQRAGSIILMAGPQYASGWYVRRFGSEANWWHDGSLPGTSALVARSLDGIVWVSLFNARAKDAAGFARALDAAMWNVTGAVKEWPSGDLFSKYR